MRASGYVVMHRTPLLTAAVAALALAVPTTAGAASPMKPVGPIPVPAGEAQHTVRTISWETDVGKPWSRRVETWATADAARTIHRDLKTGELLSDCADDGRDVRCYSAEENEIVVHPVAREGEPGITLVDSWQREGTLIKQQVEMGWFAFGADTTFQGRPMKQLEDTPSAPSDTDSRHYVTAEPETLVPWKRVITGTGKWTGGEQHFTQTEIVELREVVAPEQADLKFGTYPGVPVKRMGQPQPARAAKARALAKRKRALARKRAAAKRRAAAKSARRGR